MSQISDVVRIFSADVFSKIIILFIFIILKICHKLVTCLGHIEYLVLRVFKNHYFYPFNVLRGQKRNKS